jgi:hypothetical protein
MYHLLFDIETATKYFVRALAIYCDNVGVMNLGTGAACKAMGVCLITMGDVEQASHYRAWARPFVFLVGFSPIFEGLLRPSLSC